jgi:hypothetical protein
MKLRPGDSDGVKFSKLGGDAHTGDVCVSRSHTHAHVQAELRVCMGLFTVTQWMLKVLVGLLLQSYDNFYCYYDDNGPIE